MRINIGTPDRIVRIVLGLLVASAPFLTGWTLFASTLWTALFVIVGLVLVVTAVIRFCPAYAVLDLSTNTDSKP